MRKFDWNNESDDTTVSTWARGQAWGLYGYTMMYGQSNDSNYLRNSELEGALSYADYYYVDAPLL